MGVQVVDRLPLNQFHQPRIAETDDHPLALQVDLQPFQTLQHGHRGKPRLGAPADVAVVAREDPRGGALEHCHVRDSGLDGRHELHRRGAGADDSDPLAGQVKLVIPSRGARSRVAEGQASLTFCAAAV